MHLALLALALQLETAALIAEPQQPQVSAVADSVRDLKQARGAQASFERSRRSNLPIGYSSSTRCEVRVGRFCWWYDDSMPTQPPEAEVIGRHRADLLATLDRAAALHPGDEWLAAMRVHYRIDARNFASADSTARECRAAAWLCSALVGYVAHTMGESSRADSAFTDAVKTMAGDKACAWRDIRELLRDEDRDAYERQSCDARHELEARYWLLSRPQLGGAANDWKNEFNTRRVLAWLAERAATPQGLRWGNDAAALIMRFGWPTAWSRTDQVPGLVTEPNIIGHDPVPSFAFGPTQSVADQQRALPPEAWNLANRAAEARYAPRLVKRVAGVSAQLARFRRGDSTLLVAAFSASDDSLRAPIAVVGAALADGLSVLSVPDTGTTGRARVMLAGLPVMAGVEIADTTTRTLARVRFGYAQSPNGARLELSDLLMYRAGEAPATSLDSALARAIPGDSASRAKPIGVFWETYGLVAEGETVDLAVAVERIDRNWFRSARQRLGITPDDSPLRMRWTDARPPADRAAPHAVSLDLGNLEAGRYRITLTLTPVSGEAASSSREIELNDH